MDCKLKEQEVEKEVLSVESEHSNECSSDGDTSSSEEDDHLSSYEMAKQRIKVHT